MSGAEGPPPPTTFKSGPTPMRRWVLWLVAIGVMVGTLGIQWIALGPETSAVSNQLKSRKMDLGGATFILAGGWAPTAPPAGVPAQAQAYSWNGVTFTIWTETPGAAPNAAEGARRLVQAYFPAQYGRGDYFQISPSPGVSQVRVGLPNEVALTSANTDPAAAVDKDIGKEAKSTPKAEAAVDQGGSKTLVLAFSSGAPLASDGKPAGQSSNRFSVAFEQVNQMMQSVEISGAK